MPFSLTPSPLPPPPPFPPPPGRGRRVSSASRTGLGGFKLLHLAIIKGVSRNERPRLIISRKRSIFTRPQEGPAGWLQKPHGRIDFHALVNLCPKARLSLSFVQPEGEGNSNKARNRKKRESNLRTWPAGRKAVAGSCQLPGDSCCIQAAYWVDLTISRFRHTDIYV